MKKEIIPDFTMLPNLSHDYQYWLHADTCFILPTSKRQLSPALLWYEDN